MDTKIQLSRQLPDRLVNELYRIADKYQKKGVRLFIFGSFANATNRTTSDLDIGVLWQGKRSSRIFRNLYNDIHDLPTIRKIDLVDMDQVDKAFKNKVFKKDILFLSDRMVKV